MLLDSFTLRYWNLTPDVTGQQWSCSICNYQLFNLRLFLEMIAVNMTNFSMTETLLSNRPVGAQVGHAGPVVNRIGLSSNMEEERILCDP